jgi:hypothetical protein
MAISVALPTFLMSLLLLTMLWMEGRGGWGWILIAVATLCVCMISSWFARLWRKRRTKFSFHQAR